MASYATRTDRGAKAFLEAHRALLQSRMNWDGMQDGLLRGPDGQGCQGVSRSTQCPFPIAHEAEGTQGAKTNPINSWAWGVTVCVTGPHAKTPSVQSLK